MIKKILKQLKDLGDARALEGMSRFGIHPKNAYGISIPKLRAMARSIGKDHALALKLWDSGVHEARILASMIDDPKKTTAKQMDRWVKDFYSWDVCDQACSNLFRHTPFAYKKAFEWCAKDKEFVKRAGFTMMACLAVGDKKADDKKFEAFFPPIKKGSSDPRNFVKKAVNWALRQIGKRNLRLNKRALEKAYQIRSMQSPSARWIASDAIRELESPAVQERLKSTKEENNGRIKNKR